MKSFSSDSCQQLFEEANKVIGELTALESDCGELCGKACCKGEKGTGMRLFPGETTEINETDVLGARLCVCSGSCERKMRPLACRIFPFFPVINENGRISAQIDVRAIRLCPLVENCDKVRFSRDFLRAVRKVGRILIKNAECKSFITETSLEIEQYAKLYGFNKKISKRK